MATAREKQLAIAILKERIEYQTGKKIILKEDIITEAGISSKDWQRMLDLDLAGDDGSKVARSITDKNKAIARFIAGLKISGSNISLNKNYRGNPEYNGDYSALGNKALQLGATPEEIQSLFDQTTVPDEYTTKQKELSTKKLQTYAGPISKAVLKSGYDIEFIKTNGDALTNVGRDAMSRNGRKWTIGYKTIIDLGNGKKIDFDFDAITDEGGGTCLYTSERIGWKEYGIREFLIKLLTYLQKQSSSQLDEDTQVLDTDTTFTPVKALSDKDEVRPSRMKKPGEISNYWVLMGRNHSGLYIQDECRDMMVDKYGEKGEKIWKGLIDAGTGPFFQFATKVAAEKAWLVNELDLQPCHDNYWKYSYFDMWKEWMKRIGKSVDIKQPVPSSAVKPTIDTKLTPTLANQPKSISSIRSSIIPDSKDEMRISDIASKAGGNKYKMQSLAVQMANKITDPKKAYRRGLAAEDENYHDLAQIFFDRADKLGLQEDVKTTLKEEYKK